MEFPKSFNLVRNEKIVAHGTLFPSGKAAVNWTGEYSSVVVWDSFDDLVKVNGHSNTKFVFQEK